MSENKQKLIITIVRKEKSKSVVQATKKAGATGGTILRGRGIKNPEKNRFLGIPLEREREIILTLVHTSAFPDAWHAIERSASISKPGHGICFALDLKKLIGVAHQKKQDGQTEKIPEESGGKSMEKPELQYDLIVTIVNKGDSEKVVDASRKKGAEGGTIINGRGTGVHEKAKLFNILIEPEKEVVLTLVTKDLTKDVLSAIENDASLEKAGKGIAFVMDVDQTTGINHVLNKKINDTLRNDY